MPKIQPMIATRMFAGLLIAALLPLDGWSQTRPRSPAPKRVRPQERAFRSPDRLREGDTAPDFRLKSPDGKRTVRLSSFRNKKPVALVFGSYT